MVLFRQRQWFSKGFREIRRRSTAFSPDRYIQATQFREKFGRDLDLEIPVTFNEKIHWLMLNYRIPEMTRLADKHEVRAYVAARVGDWLLNDLYGVWEDPADVDFDRLPESFVLKVTSGSGQNILCRSKSLLNVEQARVQLRDWMRRNEYWVGREWAYKNIKPKIICEKYLMDEEGHIPCDYKLFCFHGEPRFVQVDTDRFSNHCRDLFDLRWEVLPFSYSYPPSGVQVPRPQCLETMVSIARTLSEGFPFVRVDLYSTHERVVFGEMTWYPEGGLGRFNPEAYDVEIGKLLMLHRAIRPSFADRVWSKVTCPIRSAGRPRISESNGGMKGAPGSHE